jgi:hypothetical protein
MTAFVKTLLVDGFLILLISILIVVKAATLLKLNILITFYLIKNRVYLKFLGIESITY